jgi:glycosyltransferase involved in cell wall biosynthesis
MRVALIGTRGVPARYGGFETAVEEIGRRLVASGHDVTVYCRPVDGEPRPASYLGMRLVHLPAVRRKTLETLSHTALSVAHAVTRRQRFDAAVVFNAANAPFVPGLRLRRIPVAVHVDGLEWRRAKWTGAGRRYYRTAESASVRWADALIADAVGIADYYEEEFGVATTFVPYGAPILDSPASEKLAALDVEPGRYHLVVARFEPENHVREIVAGYRASRAEHPLVVVGSAPYADTYTAEIETLAAGDSRVRLVGGVWDQEQLDQLYAHATTYLHGHSVGGTNPSLLRAMGAGAPVIAYDVVFNREVLGDSAPRFATPDDLARLVEKAEGDPDGTRAAGRLLQDRAAQRYRWDDVADAYAELLVRLVDGYSTRGAASGRRRDRAD